MKLSIITTLYSSLSFLEKYINEFIAILEDQRINDYEFIFVNDGSKDDSLQFLLQKQNEYSNFVIVDLARNFGHHYALQAGIVQAKGDLIYLCDNDLETPSDFLIDCLNAYNINTHVDLIYGVQDIRKGSFSERVGGLIFWKLMNKLSYVTIPSNLLTECLMTRKFVIELLNLGDSNLFLGGMIHWVGLNKMELTVKKGQRSSKSTYTFKKRLELLFKAFTSFSGKPLVWMFYLGLFFIVASLFIIFILVARKLLLGSEINIGWTSLIITNIFGVGVLSTFLGIMGMYVSNIFTQVQHRPNFVIKKIYRNE